MIPYNNEGQVAHEKVFLSFIKDFLAKLSAKKVNEAYLMLDDASNHSNAWSKQDLALFLDLNMEDEPYLTIDDPNEVTLPSNHRFDLYEYKDGSGYGTEYDLTSKGELNDFTIMFDFIKGNEGYLVYLTDIHVL